MRYQHYEEFRENIFSSAVSAKFPLRLMFELTYRCNFKCRHCYVPLAYRRKNELKTREVFSVLEELRGAGCFYLGFTGGEPFMRRDIMDILLRAKKCGFQVIIYTNGSLINKKIAAELGRLSLNKVDITIPAMSRDVFERISGVEGSRDKVFSAIDLLHKNNVPLGFKTCVLRENENQIEDIRGFARSLGALHRLDDALNRRLDGSVEPFRYRGKLIQEASFRHCGEAVVRRSNLKGCGVKLKESRKRDCFALSGLTMTDEKALATDLFRCGVGRTQAAITPQGELKPCLMIDEPRYKIAASLKKSWERLKEFTASIELDENYRCNKCGLAPYCKWCPAKGWLYNRSFTSCAPESRRRAERIKYARL